MKKKFLTIVGTAAFAVAVAFNINAGFKSDTVSDLALANVEALAQGEGSGNYTCYPSTTYLHGGNVIKCNLSGNCTTERDLVGSGSTQSCSTLVN